MSKPETVTTIPQHLADLILAYEGAGVLNFLDGLFLNGKITIEQLQCRAVIADRIVNKRPKDIWDNGGKGDEVLLQDAGVRNTNRYPLTWGE